MREHPKAGLLAVATVCVGAFMGQLDASIVTLAFPALQRQFHAPLAAVQWESLAYLVTVVGLLAAVGRLADAVGRKPFYLYGLAVFTVASVACGLAPGLAWLVAFRLLQAVGAAMLQANSVALIVTSVPVDRARAMLGVQAAAQALGLAAGPLVGGALVAVAGWPWVFWVNGLVGVGALVAARYLLPRTRARTPITRFDWPGLLLLALATTTLLLALSGPAGLPVPGWSAAALVAVAALTGAGFVLRERRAESPLVDLRVVRPAPVAGGLAGALGAYLVLFGPLALFPQVLGGVGALRVGLVLTALPAGFAVAATAGERLLPVGTRARLLAGAGLCAGAAGTLAAVPTSVPWVAGLLGALGVGLGMFIPANNSSIMAAVPERASAVGGGLVNMSRGLGTALGVALVTLSLHAAGHGPAGARVALAVLAGCAALAGGTGLVADRGQGRGRRGGRAAPPRSRTDR